MKKYIANYIDKKSGSSWSLVFKADNYKDALKKARKATHGLMAGCKFDNMRVEK